MSVAAARLKYVGIATASLIDSATRRLHVLSCCRHPVSQVMQRLQVQALGHSSGKWPAAGSGSAGERRSLSGGPLKWTWNSEMLSSTSSTCQSLITATTTKAEEAGSESKPVPGSRRQPPQPARGCGLTEAARTHSAS